MYDLVMPNGNEDALIERSKQLGIKPIFVYNFSKITDFLDKKKKYPDVFIGALIEFEGDKSNRFAKEVKNKVDLVVGSANFKESFVRQILSSKHFDILINVCASGGTMHTHYQYSNMNQVTAKLVRDKNIIYCVNFNNILKNTDEKRALLMSRIMQNVKILKKYKALITIASFADDKYFLRNAKFYKALLKLLGYSLTRDPIKERIFEKLEKKQPDFIKKGVRIIN